MKYLDLLLLDESPEQATRPITCPHCGAVDRWEAQYCDLTATQPMSSGGDFPGSYEVHDQSLNVRYVTCANCNGLVWFDREWFIVSGETQVTVDLMVTLLRQAFARETWPAFTDALVARSATQMDWAVDEARQVIRAREYGPTERQIEAMYDLPDAAERAEMEARSRP